MGKTIYDFIINLNEWKLHGGITYGKVKRLDTGEWRKDYDSSGRCLWTSKPGNAARLKGQDMCRNVALAAYNWLGRAVALEVRLTYTTGEHTLILPARATPAS